MNQSSKESGAPWYVRIIFWLQRRHYGEVLNSARLWAKSPRVFLGLSFLYGALDRKTSPLSPQIRSLIIVRVSQLNGCAFCTDLNTSVLLKRGVPIGKINALNGWRKSSLFTECEKATLDYTESVIYLKKTSPILRKKLSQFYAPEELVEMTALIAFQNMSTTFNNAFDIDPQGFCHLS